MPTLETAEVFDDKKMRTLRNLATSNDSGDSDLCWRVGGNDLCMNLIGVRRSRTRTIYDSPLAPCLAMLASIFRPAGFNLTAPVFELLDHRELLDQEVPRDIEYGFMGKTAIPPRPSINYRITLSRFFQR